MTKVPNREKKVNKSRSDITKLISRRKPLSYIKPSIMFKTISQTVITVKCSKSLSRFFNKT